MRKGMIADHVSASDNFSRNVRPPLHILPNQKKSGAYLVFAQDVEQPQRVRIIRPVVKREGEALATWRSAERSPEPLPHRRHGLVSGRNGRTGRSGSGDGDAKHGGIVNAPDRAIRRMHNLENELHAKCQTGFLLYLIY